MVEYDWNYLAPEDLLRRVSSPLALVFHGPYVGVLPSVDCQSHHELVVPDCLFVEDLGQSLDPSRPPLDNRYEHSELSSAASGPDQGFHVSAVPIDHYDLPDSVAPEARANVGVVELEGVRVYRHRARVVGHLVVLSVGDDGEREKARPFPNLVRQPLRGA